MNDKAVSGLLKTLKSLCTGASCETWLQWVKMVKEGHRKHTFLHRFYSAFLSSWKIWMTLSLSRPIFSCCLGSQLYFCCRSPDCSSLLCLGNHWRVALESCSLSLLVHPICQCRACIHCQENIARTSLFLETLSWTGIFEYITALCLLIREPRGLKTTLGPVHHYAVLVAPRIRVKSGLNSKIPKRFSQFLSYCSTCVDCI